VVINQLLSHVRTDGTFWVISTNTNFINHLPTKGAPDQIKQSIPQIQNFILEGDLGNMVTASLRSQCANEEAAKNLSDFARGLVALGKMFTAQRPELAGILADVRVSQDATEKTLVTVEISVPFEDLKKLKKMETRQGTSSAIKAF
jgi:hypothetical protein